MTENSQAASEQRMTLLITLLMWWVTSFGVVLASAILCRMPPMTSFLLAIGAACASTPFGAVIGGYIAGIFR
ncbi:MAG TPA: hypothetical protein VNQ76_07965 [Planctomicrobium sp.]|nr:hypothetical protein [Planctomicrobium sp.]